MEEINALVAAVRDVVGAARELWGPNAPELVKNLIAKLDGYDAAHPQGQPVPAVTTDPATPPASS